MLCLYRFGGAIWSTEQALDSGVKIEEWSCSLSLEGAVGSLPSVWPTGTPLFEWFTDPLTGISNTVELLWIELNEFDPVTGHQVTDPTQRAEAPWGTRQWGGRGNTLSDPDWPPTTQSSRVSLDNGTRNRRARGGFFLPRYSKPIGSGGRFNTIEQQSTVDITVTFLQALATATGMNIAVWSRAEGGAFPVTRVRMGDVPDNIRRRKSDLDETYMLGTL